MSPYTEKRHNATRKSKKKIADQPIDSYIFLTFCQKNEVSQLSDVPVATFPCASFVINGNFAFGFSFPC
jgi:hypothetical protein